MCDDMSFNMHYLIKYLFSAMSGNHGEWRLSSTLLVKDRLSSNSRTAASSSSEAAASMLKAVSSLVPEPEVHGN